MAKKSRRNRLTVEQFQFDPPQWQVLVDRETPLGFGATKEEAISAAHKSLQALGKEIGRLFSEELE
jgi:hypothetical protein